MSRRSVGAIVLGVVCAVSAAYCFTIGRRPIDVDEEHLTA